ncbi:MAG: hypothetical protein Q8M32_08680 [Brevundimonas sp.]|nr:hypothetical protein [Brevundimonas sp.]
MTSPASRIRPEPAREAGHPCCDVCTDYDLVAIPGADGRLGLKACGSRAVTVV